MPTMAELAAAIVARQEMPPEKGELGPIGPNGKAGLDGSNGRNGDPGPKGATGDRGPIGSNGADGRNGADGKDGVDGEPGLVWRGPWVRNMAYYPDDAVEQDGSSYVCTVATRSKPPSGAWDLLAKRGATGPPGMSRGGGGGGGGGSALTVKDEGTVLDTAAASIDFTGAGVTATAAGHSLTVTIPGGGGSQDLEAVLTVGNDGANLGIVSPGVIRGADSGAATGASLEVEDASDPDGGEFSASGGANAAGGTGASLELDPSNADAGGGYATLAGGDSVGDVGGSVSFRGGESTGGWTPGEFVVTGAAFTGAGSISAVGGSFTFNTPITGLDVDFRANTSGDVRLFAGDGALGGIGSKLELVTGDAVADGRIGVVSGGSSGAIGDVLIAQAEITENGIRTALWGTVIAALIAGGGQAAFVPDPATPEQIRDALVAVGIMAAV